MSVELEAMKCLNFLKNESINEIACLKGSVTTKTLYQLYFANFDTIEQGLIKAQEMENENAELKEALRIIKEKDVDIFMLNDLENLEDYNGCISIKYGEYYQLTQEEYDLLMKYFKKDKSKEN